MSALRTQTSINVKSAQTSKCVHSDWRKRGCNGLICVIAITLAAASMLGITTPAHALTKATNSAKPWVIRALSYARGDLGDSCTGVAINEQMVVTAAHCKADVIKYEDIDHWITVDAHYPIDGADIQVLVLRDSHPISQYPALGPDRLATANSAIPVGTIGAVYGYGSGDDLPQKQLSVRIDRHGATPTKREYLQAIAANGGAMENGDSGGPLIINNQLVGILSGTRTHPKDGHIYAVFSGISPALSTIRQLEHSREMRSVAEQTDSSMPWISAVKVENQAVFMTLSDELINSGQQIVAWVNGRYLGDVQGDLAHYATRENIPGGAIYGMGGFPVRDTDFIQIGIVTGASNPESATLLYESVPAGIEAVSNKDGKLSVTMSSQLINSGHQIVMWVNGKYTGEVQNNRAYYAEKRDIDGASILTFPYTPTQAGDLIQIGIITDINAPDASMLLYSGRPSGIQAVAINNGKLSVTMSTELVHSGRNVFFWINGRYAGNVENDVSYYCSKTNVDGGSIVSPNTPVHDGDLIQIGIDLGAGPESPQASGLLYENRTDDIDSVY